MDCNYFYTARKSRRIKNTLNLDKITMRKDLDIYWYFHNVAISFRSIQFSWIRNSFCQGQVLQKVCRMDRQYGALLPGDLTGR